MNWLKVPLNLRLLQKESLKKKKKKEKKKEKKKRKKRNNLSPCVLSLALEIRETGIRKPGIILDSCFLISMHRKILSPLLLQKMITFLQKEKPLKAGFPLLNQLHTLTIA